MKIINNLPRKIKILQDYLPLDGDSKDTSVSFASNDTESATEWTDVNVLSSGEKHASIFNKVSTMFKNMRYLYKMLGIGIDIAQSSAMSLDTTRAVFYGQTSTFKKYGNRYKYTFDIKLKVALSTSVTPIASNLPNELENTPISAACGSTHIILGYVFNNKLYIYSVKEVPVETYVLISLGN